MTTKTDTPENPREINITKASLNTETMEALLVALVHAGIIKLTGNVGEKLMERADTSKHEAERAAKESA